LLQFVNNRKTITTPPNDDLEFSNLLQNYQKLKEYNQHLEDELILVKQENKEEMKIRFDNEFQLRRQLDVVTRTPAVLSIIEQEYSACCIDNERLKIENYYLKAKCEYLEQKCQQYEDGTDIDVETIDEPLSFEERCKQMEDRLTKLEQNQ